MKYALSMVVILAVMVMVVIAKNFDTTDSALNQSSSSSSAGVAFTEQEKQDIARQLSERGFGSGSIVTDRDAVEALMKLQEPIVAEPADLQRTEVKNILAHHFSRSALLRTTNRSGSAFGTANAESGSGSFTLLATFLGLPALLPSQYFEGWIVRTEPFAYVSVGKVEELHGSNTILFSGSQSYGDFDRFVLTIESDANLEPGEHILEGTFQ